MYCLIGLIQLYINMHKKSSCKLWKYNIQLDAITFIKLWKKCLIFYCKISVNLKLKTQYLTVFYAIIGIFFVAHIKEI